MTGRRRSPDTPLAGTIPLFPLAGCILLPRAELPLNIFEPRYLRMVDHALGAGRLIGMIQPREDEGEHAPALYAIGGVGRITSFSETGDGRYLITLTGLSRFRLVRERRTETPYRVADVDYDPFSADAEPERAEVDRDLLMETMRDYLDAQNLSADWDAATSAPPEALVNSLAMCCPFAPSEKQALLEARGAVERADCLIALMRMGGAGPESDPVIQ